LPDMAQKRGGGDGPGEMRRRGKLHQQNNSLALGGLAVNFVKIREKGHPAKNRWKGMDPAELGCGDRKRKKSEGVELLKHENSGRGGVFRRRKRKGGKKNERWGTNGQRKEPFGLSGKPAKGDEVQG